MPTDPAALADEFEDNAGRLLYYAGNNSDRLFSAEECQQIAAALRQSADPRTALALRLLEIVETARNEGRGLFAGYASHFLVQAKVETP